MAATWPLDPIQREHPRLTSEEIDDRFLIEGLKVKPCEFGADCEHGPAKCPFLHPGDKGRRDRFCYSSTPCPHYSLKTRSCPEGNSCPFAHGFMERWFHPPRYPHVTGCELSDLKELSEYILDLEYILEQRLKKEGRLHDADAEERTAIEPILDLKKGNGLNHGYKTFNIPLDHAYVPVSFYDFIGNDLKIARIATDAIHQHYSFFKSVTGITIGNGNAFTFKKNAQPMLVPASWGCSGPPQGLFSNFYKGSNKLFPKHCKDIAVTPLEERVEPPWAQPHLLSAVNAPPMTGWSGVPQDPNRGRVQRPIYFDSGASVHVVGHEWMLQGYQVLAEPWQIAVGDGHPLVVVGIGFISQEGFMIPNVFHVLGLQMNLISVSQLDRGHGLFSGFHDGICKVLKRGGDVVGGGYLLANGLYALSFLEVPEAETLQAPETETLQVPETETETGGEAEGYAIPAL